ncbi:hypothetical protein HPP92_023795 [Vanilla planifolia]|uniref:Tafazzin family protein n=1 Tax=Vanilla planifolia TaxID=51239 RepID=A0A835PNG9_VANPL|nr:hypothetical protein HPP92_023795 [Vanilla planifolia]
MNAQLARWVLAAEDICFRNAFYSYLFRLGKCIPITRGGGIYQQHMNEALEVLASGGWLHTFPEGKISQENGPIRRLKWGTASLIVRAPITPLVLPIIHCGFDKVMPEKYMFDRRPLFPLINKHIKVIVGEPLEFDVQSLRQKAKVMSLENSQDLGWPKTSLDGLSEGSQRWLYANISDQLREVMEKLRCFGSKVKRLKELIELRIRKLKYVLSQALRDTTGILQSLELIDTIQHLGVSYHFQIEINEALTTIHDVGIEHTNDLHTIALGFRLLREQRLPISADVFNSFLDKEGEFKASLIANVKKLSQAYLEEKQWGIQGYVPNVNDHLKVSLISCAYPLLVFCFCVGMEETIPEEIFHWVASFPKIVRAMCIICK